MTLLLLLLALLSPQDPEMWASCTGPMVPGKLCQVRVLQDYEDFLVVGVSGPHQPLTWTPYLLETDGPTFVWGLDWMTAPLTCEDTPLVTIELLDGESLAPLKTIELGHYCLAIPEAHNVR
jgi:hypothetical protein